MLCVGCVLLGKQKGKSSQLSQTPQSHCGPGPLLQAAGEGSEYGAGCGNRSTISFVSGTEWV